MKTKRFLAVLLTLTMIIGMLPIMANAQTAEVLYGESADSLTNSGTLESAFSSSSAKYIKLQSNVNLTSCLELWEGEKTVDLNGCTITAAEGYGVFNICQGKLDLIDTSTGTKGKVISSFAAIYFVNGYDATLNIGNSNENSGGFTIETTATDPTIGAISLSTSTATVNVYQPFTVKGGYYALMVQWGTFNGNNVPIHLIGSIFNEGTISQLNATGYAEDNAIMMSGGSLHITGGTYTCKNKGLYLLGGEVKLEGGTFESENYKAIHFDSSSEATYADLLGEGFYYTNGEDDTEISDEEALESAKKLAVAVTPTPAYAASVTTADGETTNYTDIARAINAAQNSEGSTLKLLDNIDDKVIVSSGKFTIDLNSKTWMSSYSSMVLTFDGGDVIITDNSTEGAGRIVSTETTTHLLGDAKLEIAGGTLETQSSHCVVVTGGSGQTSDAEFILSGGKLVTDGWAAIDVNCRSVTIKGGEIESLGDDNTYQSGLLDFSQHPDPTGYGVFFILGKIRTTEAIRIKLPEGYCLYESGNVASKLESDPTYTVGKVIEGNKPGCICENKNKCGLDSFNGSCNACLSDMSDCTGEEVADEKNIILFYKDTHNWGYVYAYYWGSKRIVTWRGVPMTHVGGDIWSVSVPADAVNIDFNDGTDARNNLTVPTDGRNYYDGSSWTTYICNHEEYSNGICTVCGQVCEHNTFVDDKCTVCGDVLRDIIVKYDKDTKSAIVTVKEAGTYSLIFAKYGEGNRLDKVDVVEFDFEKGINTVPQKLKDFTLGTGDKIMLWKDMTNLVPLCEAYIVK